MKTFISIIAFLLACSTAEATLLNLQPGATVGKDAQLTNAYNQSSQNLGNYQDLVTNWGDNGRSIGLIEFDLSGIVTGSVIHSAILSNLATIT
jgi:hypothetical protein